MAKAAEPIEQLQGLLVDGVELQRQRHEHLTSALGHLEKSLKLGKRVDRIARRIDRLQDLAGWDIGSFAEHLTDIVPTRDERHEEIELLFELGPAFETRERAQAIWAMLESDNFTD